jgi:hypothetical protein
MLTSFRSCQVAILLLFSSLPVRVLGGDVLQTNGFTSCDGSNAAITVQNVNITYNKATQLVDFNVAGTSNEVQNVTATMTVTAYGQQIYQKSFDPCDPSTTVAQLCPGKLL